jgi:hypothetical protein
MFRIERYSAKNKTEWDKLVTGSKNGTFLFFRDYMDYNSNKYPDHSFIIYRKNKIEGLLPGSIVNNTYISHPGLTYGGLIMSPKINTSDVIHIINLINAELKASGISEVIYKPSPFIYHSYPSQEDIYALFLLNAVKIGCSISSTIFQKNKIRFIEARKTGIRKSINKEIRVEESDRFELFWPILTENLKLKYNTHPVHSLEEIKYLNSKFPENIRLFITLIDDDVVGGCVVFDMRNIVHVQYISANDFGKKTGVLDFMFEVLVNKRFSTIPVFDFGQSTEKMGQILNGKLIFQKEGFGGRGVVYETYKYTL